MLLFRIYYFSLALCLFGCITFPAYAFEIDDPARQLSSHDLDKLQVGMTMDQTLDLFGGPIRMESGPFLSWPKQDAIAPKGGWDNLTWFGSGYWFVYERVEKNGKRQPLRLKFVASFPAGNYAKKGQGVWWQIQNMTVDWPVSHKGQKARVLMKD